MIPAYSPCHHAQIKYRDRQVGYGMVAYCGKCGKEIKEVEPERSWLQEHSIEIAWVIVVIILSLLALAGHHWKINVDANQTNDTHGYCDQYGC